MPIITPTQDWGPEINYKEYSYNAGTVSPAITAVPFVIKDTIGAEIETYPDYRLKTVITYLPAGVVAWVDPTSYESHGYYLATNSYVPYDYGMNFSFTPVFQNLAAE